MNTRQKLSECKKQLQDTAYFDQMTGLPNQVSLFAKTEEILANGGKCALLFVDIDNFRFVNDSLGYKFGNRLIKEIGGALAGLVDENCAVHILGGDKFIILIKAYKDICDVERIALKVLRGLKNPITIDERVFYNTASIGISIYPDHGSTADELLKNADIAMLKAKETGKNRIVIYKEQMNDEVKEWIGIERYLRTALENSEFELYFQPLYEIRTREITGFEALVRWRNDEMGFMAPGSFLKVAEETHLIIPIGEWIFRNACLFQKNLQQAGYDSLIISVNVSRLQLLQDDFVDTITQTIEMAGVRPESMELEITESILMERNETISEKIRRLNEYGVRIALDDFGRGYSSLSYLKQLSFNTLKIDKSFIDVLSSSEDAKALTDFTVRVGKRMNLNIVAEGVEKQEQYDCLADLNFNNMQGYLFSRPLSERDVFKKLQKP